MSSSSKKSPHTVIVERVYHAPVELVWHALTDHAAIKEWFFDIPDFRPEVGCEFAFVVEHQGRVFDHRCRVTEVVPQRRFSYAWRYAGFEGDSLVTFDLEPEGKKRTRVKVTHTGLDTFPQLPQFAPENFQEGWTSLLGHSLKDFAEANEPIHESHEEPPAKGEHEIVITRIFNAPRELVWDAMTDPKHVVNWWGPRGFTTTIEEMDVRPGGAWKHIMHGPDGTNYPNKSIFKEVMKPERLVYSHGGGREEGNDGRGASFVATWTFDAIGEKRTRLTIRMKFTSAEARDFVAKEFGAIEGGKQTLERLGEHLALARTKPFVISREYNAPRDLVWKAWTEREELLQWFGPKGFIMTEARLDFRPGGLFHYAMKSPDGKEIWGRFLYREIRAPERIIYLNSFSDREGGVTRHPLTPDPWPMQMLTEVSFAESDAKTTVTIKWVPLDPTEEEHATFEKGRPSMSQGWAGTLDRLAAHLQR